MKIVIRTLAFHALCIFIFACIYFNISNHFQSILDNVNHNSFLDSLLLSTTIQAGVGISDLTPITFYGKLMMIIQQFIMISTHVITLYIFTL